MKKEVLGIDIGNVIIDGANDLFFGQRYLSVPAVPQAMEVIGRLAFSRFPDGQVHLVSKCHSIIQAKTRDWLKEHHFFESTLVPAQNLHFCLKRHEKAPIAKKLRLTHFIDDRLEVLSHMVGLVPNLYLFRPRERDLRKFRAILGAVKVVQSWPEIEDLVA